MSQDRSKRFTLARALTAQAVLYAAVLASTSASAVPGELFISEYVEGSGNNKAIELFNGTGADVDLGAGDYQLRMFFNGNTSAGLTVALQGSVPAGTAFVLAHSGADPAVLALADQIAGGGFFNGDDVIQLVKAGVIIDTFGQVGVDPGSEWTSATWPSGVGSADNSLQRKPAVCAGDADPSDPFEPSLEWTFAASNDVTDLGAHVATCEGGEEPPPDPEPTPCGAPATPIHDVQGAGLASPLAGTQVTIEGVVAGDFQGSAGLGGFFLQARDIDQDENPLTSEGVFVFDGGAALDVHAGDVVRARGTATEYFELTEVNAVTELQVCSTGATVTPAVVTLPVPDVAALEAFEGMSVSFAQDLFATETFTQGRFGEVLLSAGGRLWQPTHVAEPGAAAQAVMAANARASIQLDDGSNVQNPALPPYLGAGGTLRIGDRVAALRGVLGFGFGAYEVHPSEPVTFTRANPREEAPRDPGGSLRVASFNVLNFFTTLDTGPALCGPAGGLDCRGANTPSEFTRQRDKILSALSRIDADIFGLIELQNDAGGALTNLVDGLNAIAGAGTYTFIDTGTIGTDAIKVAIVYKAAAVVPVGDFAILDSSVDPAFIDTRSRPVLAQTFEELSSGETFTLAVNHLKSKGSSCADIGDPDTGDGQANCNLTRVAAARAEVAWLATDPTGSGDPDVLLVGDLNSYALEDPVRALLEGGYENLVAEHIGTKAYSYVFEGQSGYLDHALATSALAEQVAGVVEWHINSDEPVMLDYNQEFNPPALYQPGPFRSSDHDPVIVGLALRGEPEEPEEPGECTAPPRPPRTHHGREHRPHRPSNEARHDGRRR
jgi:uncharacterized protein